MKCRVSSLTASVDRASPPPVRATGAAPIVLTGTMGAAYQRYFDNLRQRHFPVHRNYLAAHITLFHHLPPSVLPELCDLMRQLAKDEHSPAADVTGVMSLGGGTAFRLHCPALLTMRQRVVDQFYGMISAQDRGTPRLHVTVQNKVSPAEAKALQQELVQSFRPHTLDIIGLAAHHYLGGPWEQAFAVRFRGRR